MRLASGAMVSCISTSATFLPRLPRKMAVSQPTRPPPMTMTFRGTFTSGVRTFFTIAARWVLVSRGW